ncbi:delta-aminolevulinic acid dehydratase [Candidatus Omnitrophus magneticus]|uniref:Delta-aminolevulinic acid dehydratase n=1 Tax=Candidatus Omnitrophus magneticus TaxID=1609969 RepID=A0A0F0CRU7_9BACT|nr:delta-aminolevulinic acid dehydratase [Candidatus Omnitrophus magneticus]
MELLLEQLIYPIFVKDGINDKEEVCSMPGVYRFSLSALIGEIKRLKGLGLNKFLIFGIPRKKDINGTSAYSADNIVSRAIEIIKKNISDIIIFSDICLCAYTTHGHCGILNKENGIDLDLTLDVLSKIALNHARAGADYVAPSAMAKGQVRAIREVLDTYGYRGVKIMGYSVKFASSAYGPFREIADSSPRFGDRRAYQLDYKDKENALSYIESDIMSGADILMVKPALWFLDIVSEAKKKFNKVLAVYNVSGEYLMVKKAVESRYCNEKNMVCEIMSSFKRAGADYIITYHAKDIAEWRME